jgi:hypothetical protein
MIKYKEERNVVEIKKWNVKIDNDEMKKKKLKVM